MDVKCSICNSRVLSHSRISKCAICFNVYHLKCLSLNEIDQNYILKNQATWFCTKCLSSVLPFNCIDNDTDFHQALNYRDHFELDWSSFCQKVFNPFETYNQLDKSGFFDETDPDLNFYNEFYNFNGILSDYLSIDQFNKAINVHQQVSKLFSLCHFNIRSLHSNHSMMQNYLGCLEHEFSVVCVTETWLRDTDCDLYDMSGYIFSEYHRNNKSGGGVGIYIRNCLEHNTREDLSVFNDDFEAIFVEISNTTLNLNKNVIIGTIYRPPGSDLIGFNERIVDLMDRIVKENKICYLAGDYNINLLNHDTHQLTAEFLNIMYSNSFIPLINRPTRVTEHSATLIDNVFTNGLTSIINSLQGILISDITDHFPVFTINRNFTCKETEAVLVKRSYSDRNKQHFLQLISDLDWNEIYNCCDTQQAFYLYHQIFTKHYDTCFPKKEIKTKYNNRKPWLSEGLKQSIKIKNKLYKKSIKMKSSYNEMKYKMYKNKIKQLLLKAEKKYYSDILNINKGNMRKIWSIMKEIIGRNKQKKLQGKFRLSDGSITGDKYIISERFNDFFIGIGPSLAGKIPNQSKNPKQYLKNKLLKSIFLAPVTSLEIGSIIKNLRNSAPGHDEVTASILQLSLPFITDPLVFILNMSLS